MSPNFCCNIWSKSGKNDMKAQIHPALYQWLRLLVVSWCRPGILSWHTLGPLIPTEHCLNTTVYLSIVADPVYPFMTLLMSTFSRKLWQNHKNQIISKWFIEPDDELKWPPWSPNSNPIENLRDVVECEICIVDVKLTNLEQLCYVSMDWNPWGMFPALCWIYVWRQRSPTWY